MLSNNNFATKWWARRWLSVVVTFGAANRLARGHDYACRGRVTQIKITEGHIFAKVQGTRTKAYEVSIDVDHLDQEQWNDLFQILSKKKRLLKEADPNELLQLLKENNFPLLPGRDEVDFSCSCPGWENPCKHVIAVVYMTAQTMDYNPFVLFRLRGRDWADIASEMERRQKRLKQRRLQQNTDFNLSFVDRRLTAPLSAGKGFWNAKKPLDRLRFNYKAPAETAFLVKTLGEPPSGLDQQEFVTRIEECLARLKSER